MNHNSFDQTERSAAADGKMLSSISPPQTPFAASAVHRQAAQSVLKEVLHCAGEQTEIDVSLVVTFHREGLLASWTLQGLQTMRQHAQEKGLSVQLIAMLDRPDADTLELVKGHPALGSQDWVLRVDAGDPGTSRNVGVLFAQGNAIGVVDGDDFCSPAWIWAAHHLVQDYGSSVVVHPEYIVSFEKQHVLHRQVDQRVDTFPLAACVATHPWGSMVMAHALIFKTTPYQPTRAQETGFGYEDWHWNLEVLSKGVLHICAAETAHYYRRRVGSVLHRETAHRALLRPSGFFDSPEDWQNGFALCDAYRAHAHRMPQLAPRKAGGQQERI